MSRQEELHSIKKNRYDNMNKRIHSDKNFTAFKFTNKNQFIYQVTGMRLNYKNTRKKKKIITIINMST